MTGASLPTRLKDGYAVGMRRIGSALTRAGALPRTVPPREQRGRHWLYSLPLVRDVQALADLDVPWWTYPAIDLVDEWLAVRGATARVLEYGSGASTVWLGRRAARVDSVEHDAAFAKVVAGLTAGLPGVHLHRVPAPAAARPVVGSAKAGHRGLDFSDYVAAADGLGGPFDLIVIDGRARAACLQRAVVHLAGDGLVVFDNSARRRYRAAIATSGLREQKLRGLVPTLPYPDQTSVLTRASDSSTSIGN